MKTKLLPCPFCGKTPKIPTCADVESSTPYRKWLVAFIHCPCGISKWGHREDTITDDLAIKDAIKEWNKRV